MKLSQTNGPILHFYDGDLHSSLLHLLLNARCIPLMQSIIWVFAALISVMIAELKMHHYSMKETRKKSIRCIPLRKFSKKHSELTET